MAMPEFTMRQLLEAGVHFGHHTRRWNPKMRQYIFGVRNGVHIIDLQQTVPMLNTALKTTRDIVANGGRILFVGTKRQAQNVVKETSKRCGQYYVNHRWLGGMLTNWKTISQSINRLRELDGILDEGTAGRTKKEVLMLTRERNKLEQSIGGIKEMGGLPDALFIIDTNKEDIAIAEANRLGIPVIAVIDTNSDFQNIDYPIPGNDDALRAIELYCDLMSEAILDGLQAEVSARGADPGTDVDAGEKLPKKKGAAKKETAAKADKKTAKEEAAKGDEKKPEEKSEKAADADEADAETVKKQATA